MGHMILGTSTETSCHVSPLYLADGRGPSKSIPYMHSHLTVQNHLVWRYSLYLTPRVELVSCLILISRDDYHNLHGKGQDVYLFLVRKCNGGKIGGLCLKCLGKRFLQDTKIHNRKQRGIHGKDSSKNVQSTDYGSFFRRYSFLFQALLMNLRT